MYFVRSWEVPNFPFGRHPEKFTIMHARACIIQNKLRNDSLSPAQERRYKKLKDDIISEVKSLRLTRRQ
jgi:hypothetical protein